MRPSPWREAFAYLWRLQIRIWTVRFLRVKLAIVRARTAGRPTHERQVEEPGRAPPLRDR
jgi:hypothetical protein